MALMTLVEYAKGLDDGDIAKPVIEIFAASSDIMSAIPIAGFSGAQYEHYRESELPSTVAFRGINEAPTTGLGKIEALSEPSFPIDHHADVDNAIVRRHGVERRAIEEKLSIAKVGRVWAATFVAGDNETQPREFDGIQKRVAKYGADTATNTRLAHNSAAAGGAPLSLANLDSMLNMINGATHILAPRSSIPLFIGAARDTTLTGFVMQTWDETGMPKLSYAGKKLLFGYEREIEGDLTDFDEVATGGGAAVTGSLYGMKLSEDGLHGIQLMDIDVQDKGLIDDGITWRTHVSWDVGLVDEHPFCLARLTSITNAAIVA